MNSIGAECNELKKKYEGCFNTWFSEGFLRGDTRDPCQGLFKDYQNCIKGAVEKQKINLWEIEGDILGTDKEKKMPPPPKS